MLYTLVDPEVSWCCWSYNFSQLRKIKVSQGLSDTAGCKKVLMDRQLLQIHFNKITSKKPCATEIRIWKQFWSWKEVERQQKKVCVGLMGNNEVRPEGHVSSKTFHCLQLRAWFSLSSPRTFCKNGNYNSIMQSVERQDLLWVWNTHLLQIKIY